ncbi:unnamed protein product [Lactuca saligna]|uniref:Uncharacterized protein n=1 Tax=Lactuca saligna TaxID=75948 RepID=A0AA36E976_LACSI|nr:unnamed protein product [Lactuca saligna]
MDTCENILFMDQIVSTTMLIIRVYQNLVADLNTLKYNPNIQPLIESLNYSPLKKALTMSEKVSLCHLSKAYSTSSYNSAEEVMNFEHLAVKPQPHHPGFVDTAPQPYHTRFVDLQSQPKHIGFIGMWPSPTIHM